MENNNEQVKEHNELQKIHRKHINEKLLPWQKTFPDIFYHELFRLNGWNFTVEDIKKRSSCIGTWTNKLIYEQLPPSILDELRKKSPKGKDISNPYLKDLVTQIITLFQISDNMKHMWNQYEKLKSHKSEKPVQLPFTFDEKGHTITPIEEIEPLSDFNKYLKKALEYKEEPAG